MADNPIIDNQQTEVRLFYKEISQLLRNKYNPHFNLYQKQNLTEKVECYNKNQNQPDQYYDCIQAIDEKMIFNSQQLSQKYNIIEENDKECQEKCAQSYKENQQMKNQCVMKCLTNMKEQCLALQNQFYDSILKQNPEYKKIKTQ